ncbi:MAG: hypothetical protein KAJ18_11485 [Candidatus Omnitrophica bacterium]|nr:hypothetical protein [Candidatus Omnitrophota bacterium]
MERKTYDFDNSDPMKRDQAYNELAKDLFKVDFENKEFLFVMLNSIISLLLTKGLITEQEFSDEVEKTTQSFKLMKYRKNLMDNQ